MDSANREEMFNKFFEYVDRGDDLYGNYEESLELGIKINEEYNDLNASSNKNLEEINFIDRQIESINNAKLSNMYTPELREEFENNKKNNLYKANERKISLLNKNKELLEKRTKMSTTYLSKVVDMMKTSAIDNIKNYVNTFIRNQYGFLKARLDRKKEQINEKYDKLLKSIEWKQFVYVDDYNKEYAAYIVARNSELNAVDTELNNIYSEYMVKNDECVKLIEFIQGLSMEEFLELYNNRKIKLDSKNNDSIKPEDSDKVGDSDNTEEPDKEEDKTEESEKSDGSDKTENPDENQDDKDFDDFMDNQYEMYNRDPIKVNFGEISDLEKSAVKEFDKLFDEDNNKDKPIDRDKIKFNWKKLDEEEISKNNVDRSATFTAGSQILRDAMTYPNAAGALFAGIEPMEKHKMNIEGTFGEKLVEKISKSRVVTKIKSVSSLVKSKIDDKKSELKEKFMEKNEERAEKRELKNSEKLKKLEEKNIAKEEKKEKDIYIDKAKRYSKFLEDVGERLEEDINKRPDLYIWMINIIEKVNNEYGEYRWIDMDLVNKVKEQLESINKEKVEEKGKGR